MTQKRVRPTDIEARLAAPDWQTILTDVETNTPAARILRGHAALKTQNKSLMSEAAVSLKADRSLFARGTLASLYSELGDRIGVLTIPLSSRPPRNTTDMHGAFWLHFARAMVMCDMQAYVEALQEYGEAAALARWIGEQPKVQIIEMHVQLTLNQMGRGAPRRVARTLLEPMADGRRAWHTTENLVAAHMQVGNYQWALEVAKPGHHYHGLMHAMLGRGLPAETSEDARYNVARAWAYLWAGHPHQRVVGLRGNIMRTYGVLAHGLWMAGDSTSARQVPELLSVEPPSRPDQAVIWAVTQLQAFARGAFADAPLDLPNVVQDGMERLEDRQFVLALLSRLAPEGLILAACHPNHHPEIMAAAFILAEQTKMAPSSVVSISNAYALKPWRGEPGRPVNPGVFMSGIERMMQAAVDENRLELEANWASVRTQFLSELRPSSRSALGTAPLHCIVKEDERTLRA